MEKSAAEALKAVPEATRPRFLDYFLILVGLASSVFLGEISGIRAVHSQATPSILLEALVKVFPTLLFLTLGVVLLWPIFYVNQKVLGRTQELTWAEWLWGLAWLGSLAMIAWIGWQRLVVAPEHIAAGVMSGYVLFSLSMGALAILLFLVGLLGRWTVPWTHTFALVLLMWPVIPLGAWWLLGIQLE